MDGVNTEWRCWLLYLWWWGYEKGEGGALWEYRKMWMGESSPKCSQNNENRFLVQVVGACSFSLEMRGKFRGRDAVCAWLTHSESEEGAVLVVMAGWKAWRAASAMLSCTPLIAVIDVCFIEEWAK